MKKISLIILTLFFLTACSKTTKDKLEDIGYKEKEITYIEENLNEKSVSYILNNDYMEFLLNIIKEEEFKEDNLEKYIDFINKYKLTSKDAIYVVNNEYYADKYDEETLDLMKEKYFIYSNLERYLKYSEKHDKKTKDVIKEVNSNLDSDFYTNTKEADTKKGYLMLVNKYYRLSNKYVPSNLVNIDLKYGRTLQVEKKTYEQFIKMYNAAKKDGLNLYIRSPYRSYMTQSSLYNNYVLNDGKANADTYSARPGYSEHQTGLAIDITTSSTTLGKFENTKESEWLKKNAYKFGFILRYPKGKEYLTGYMYESWHYRYVGESAAKVIYDNDLTFEEYYAYYVK